MDRTCIRRSQARAKSQRYASRENHNVPDLHFADEAVERAGADGYCACAFIGANLLLTRLVLGTRGCLLRAPNEVGWLKFASTTGTAVSIAAILHLTLINSDLHTWFQELLRTSAEELWGNPFAEFAQEVRNLAANSFQIKPGAGLYGLAATLALVEFLCYSRLFARFRGPEEQTAPSGAIDISRAEAGVVCQSVSTTATDSPTSTSPAASGSEAVAALENPIAYEEPAVTGSSAADSGLTHRKTNVLIPALIVLFALALSEFGFYLSISRTQTAEHAAVIIDTKALRKTGL
jgi:hypothetical protein